MTLEHYRPWGPMRWLLSRVPNRRWTFLGCLNGEARWPVSRSILWEVQGVTNEGLFVVRDEDSRFKMKELALLNMSLSNYMADRGASRSLHDVAIMDGPDAYAGWIESVLAVEAATSVVLDISTMPKHVFFPVIRLLLAMSTVRDIVVTYTFAQAHASELGVNLKDPGFLPTFAPQGQDQEHRVFIVGLGHESVGLTKMLADDPQLGAEMRVLLPSGASRSSSRLAWDALDELMRNAGAGAWREPIRVDPRDVPEVHASLIGLTDDGKRHAVLAPFGPKPVSLALCLFACEHDNCSVMYAQPTAYNPEYSTGVALLPGTTTPATVAYAVRLNGRDCYSGRDERTPGAPNCP